MSIEMNDGLTFLITQKIGIYRTVCEVTMLWWVSTILLCLSIVGLIWYRRDSIRRHPSFKLIAIFVYLFLSTGIIYCVSVLCYFYILEQELGHLLEKASLLNTAFDTELLFAELAMINGIVTLIIVMAVWHLIYLHLPRK